MNNREWRGLAAWRGLVRAAERYVRETGPTVVDGRVRPLSRKVLIRAAMALHGVTGSDVAQAAGVHRNEVNSVIAGTIRARRAEATIADVLGVPVEFLFGPPGIKGKPREVDADGKPIRRARRVNAEVSRRRGRAVSWEDEIERARRLVG